MVALPTVLVLLKMTLPPLFVMAALPAVLVWKNSVAPPLLLVMLELPAVLAVWSQAAGGALPEAVYEQSGGNPFYLQQLLRFPGRGGAEAVSDRPGPDTAVCCSARTATTDAGRGRRLLR